MPSRNKSTQATARLQLEAPISDDASLLELQEQAADYVREAKRRAPSEPDELVSSVLDAVARDYFRHAIKKQRKRTRRALPVLLVLSAMTLFAAPAIAQTDYDGIWNVTVITRTGSCQPTTSYPLVVTDGNVSGAADLSGSVGRNGMVRASLRGAHANGRLSGNAGARKMEFARRPECPAAAMDGDEAGDARDGGGLSRTGGAGADTSDQVPFRIFEQSGRVTPVSRPRSRGIDAAYESEYQKKKKKRP